MELAVVNWLAMSRDEAVDERMDVGREDCAVLKIQRAGAEQGRLLDFLTNK
jgi:hypothetical protein